MTEKLVTDVEELLKFLFWVAFCGITIYNIMDDITDPNNTIIVKLFHLNLPMASLMINNFLLMYFGSKAWMASGFRLTEKELSERDISLW